jgi:chorismate synthase
VTIQSGTERGITLGTPISLFVPNEDQRPGDYSCMFVASNPAEAKCFSNSEPKFIDFI